MLCRTLARHCSWLLNGKESRGRKSTARAAHCFRNVWRLSSTSVNRQGGNTPHADPRWQTDTRLLRMVLGRVAIPYCPGRSLLASRRLNPAHSVACCWVTCPRVSTCCAVAMCESTHVSCSAARGMATAGSRKVPRPHVAATCHQPLHGVQSSGGGDPIHATRTSSPLHTPTCQGLGIERLLIAAQRCK